MSKEFLLSPLCLWVSTYCFRALHSGARSRQLFCLECNWRPKPNTMVVNWEHRCPGGACGRRTLLSILITTPPLLFTKPGGSSSNPRAKETTFREKNMELDSWPLTACCPVETASFRVHARLSECRCAK